MLTDQIRKHTEDDERRFLTVGERSYKYGKGKNENEPCGVGLESKILVQTHGFMNVYIN